MAMPLPMVHLAVAVQLAEIAGQPPSPSFLLGSIAPDAIHMRPNIRLGNQGDKEVTHLNHPVDTADHQRVRDMLIEYLDDTSSLKQFAAGYAAHILVDRLWIKTIMGSFRASIPTEMDDAARRTLYYQETDQIDCNLYQHMPWREAVWRDLRQAAAPDFQPWLSAAEIEGWQVRTLNWYDDPTHEPHITPQYLTDDKVAAFILATAQHLETQFATWKLAEGVV
jgi:hypothetical protein